MQRKEIFCRGLHLRSGELAEETLVLNDAELR